MHTHTATSLLTKLTPEIRVSYSSIQAGIHEK